MKDLHDEQSYRRIDVGLARISRVRADNDASSVKHLRNEVSHKNSKGNNLGSVITKGTKASTAYGKSQVSVV